MDCLTLKKSNCKNCYKCIRHCPVKSIRFSGNQAYIIGNECILCGHCFVVCPQDAKQIVDETEKVRVLLQSGDPVYVSLAPSFVANYEGVGIGAMREALQQLGFADAEETAIGATMVKNEYDRMVNEDDRDVIISSCCHSVNLLIQKYFPAQLPYLADVLSPMQAHCQDIKRRHPGAKTVFIGPCVAKKDEADFYEGFVDAVLTFDELSQWLRSENIELRREVDADENSKARFFPTTGGILKTMLQNNPKYTYMAIDGVENCIAALQDLAEGKIHHCFIEMSACAGSCIGGPVMEKFHRSPVQDYVAVANFAGKKDFVVEQPDIVSMQKTFAAIPRRNQMPSESEIADILRQMGKHTPADELNCGSCGYNTCREKAVAIYQGKAEISMCLPYLKDRAETFSDNIVRNTPNGIIVLNEKLEVQQINKAALKIMNLRSASDVLGDAGHPDSGPQGLCGGAAKRQKHPTTSGYISRNTRSMWKKPSYMTRNTSMLVCIMRDVTEEENAREKKESISRQTVEIADKVVDKQMRIVQEIASLLGETAAETKIALTKLKESISDE